MTISVSDHPALPVIANKKGGLGDDGVSPNQMDDNENPSGSPPEEVTLKIHEEFPTRVDCPQCKRPYQTETLQARVNTLLTETSLACPRCRRKLRRMRLKDWYDHYVQGQTPDPVRDEPTFAPKLTGIPRLSPKPPYPQRGQNPPNENQRGGRRRRPRRRR